MRLTSIALVLCLAGSVRVARADAPAADTKDPSTATWLSAGFAALGAGFIAAAYTRNDESGAKLAGLGLIGLTLGPSAGHWYSGEAVSAGLGLRVLGTGMILYGAAREIGCECDDNGDALALAGLGFLVFGTGYDIATAGGTADKYNRAHVMIVPAAIPSVGGPAPGMMLSGSF